MAASDSPALEEDPGEEAGGVDRSAVIGAGLRSTASWCGRFLIIGVAAAAILWLLSKI